MSMSQVTQRRQCHWRAPSSRLLAHSPATITAGGTNNYNYANVDLIVDIAKRTKADVSQRCPHRPWLYPVAHTAG
jgi:hypothetical protein